MRTYISLELLDLWHFAACADARKMDTGNLLATMIIFTCGYVTMSVCSTEMYVRLYARACTIFENAPIRHQSQNIYPSITQKRTRGDDKWKARARERGGKMLCMCVLLPHSSIYPCTICTWNIRTDTDTDIVIHHISCSRIFLHIHFHLLVASFVVMHMHDIHMHIQTYIYICIPTHHRLFLGSLRVSSPSSFPALSILEKGAGICVLFNSKQKHPCSVLCNSQGLTSMNKYSDLCIYEHARQHVHARHSTVAVCAFLGWYSRRINQ